MKKRFVLVALVCLMCLTLFAACDLGERDQDSDVKIPQEEITTAGAIYDNLDITLDRDTMLNTEAEQLAKRAFGAGKEVLGYNIADGIISVVAIVTDSSLGSVTAFISVQTQPYLEGDIKKLVLKNAGGYTIEQQIAESQSAQVAASITEAFEEIVGRIDRISEGNLRRVNYYPFEQTMQNGDQLCVFGPVRSDGSFVKLDVSENGEIYETVILVQGADEMQQEEVYDAYQNGADFVSGEPRPIDTDKLYTQPPTGQLQPDPDWGGSNPDDPTPGGDEETTTFEEIYNQVFGEGFVVPTAQDVLQDMILIARASSTDVKLICAEVSNNSIALYAEAVNRIGIKGFGKTEYIGENAAQISNYFNILKNVEAAGSLKNYVEETFGFTGNVSEGTEGYNEAVALFKSVENSLTDGEGYISTLESKDFGTTGLINCTRDTLPAPSNDFGEALMQDMGASGTIIATYVGDMGAKSLDADDIFNTGYLSGFDVAVVYQNGDEISIVTTECLVPWYTNSTNQSQYEEFVKDGGTYKLRDTQTTTIENPIDLYVMANENDSSLMGVMLQDKHSKKITDMFLV